MAVDGETLMAYNVRVGLATSSNYWSARADRLDKEVDRKSEYPRSALELLSEVETRRRLEDEEKRIKDKEIQESKTEQEDKSAMDSQSS